VPAAAGDPAQAVALVALAKRDGLLSAHRRWLRREELEDCYSQATLELLAYVRRGQCFAGPLHLGNALEQRFLSRVQDRRRALRGRSPLQAALEHALPLGGPHDHAIELIDLRAEVHPLVMRRIELQRVRELLPRLTPDQRSVLLAQVLLGAERAEFCRRHGWSHEKYRKVAQRARARLRALLDAETPDGGARAAGCPTHARESE
jgi:DNA-directed RNA polymerase specialized sigma24 family protein